MRIIDTKTNEINEETKNIFFVRNAINETSVEVKDFMFKLRLLNLNKKNEINNIDKVEEEKAL